MDVDVSAERVLPSDNIVSIVHPHMPSIEQQVQIDRSIDHTQTFEVFPEPRDIAAIAPLEFIVHSSPGYFVDLSSIIIDVKLKIYPEGGDRGDIAGQHVYFINNLSQTLWSAIKVYLNNTIVESNYNNQQIANLYHILTTPNDLVKERGIVQGAFPINPQNMADAINRGGLVANASIISRVEYAKKDVVHVRGPLHLDLSTCTKFLVDGVNIRIVLDPSSPRFLINTTPDHAWSYSIDSAKLQLTKVKPFPGPLLSTHSSIIKSPIEYMMRRHVMKTVVFPQNQRKITIFRPFEAFIPGKIYIFMVDQQGAGGLYTRYPFFYQDFGLQSYSIKVHGTEIAGSETGGENIRVYCDSLKAHGEDYFIPYNNYTEGGCFLICVDTNKGSDQNGLTAEKRGNLLIELTLNAELVRSAVVHVLGVMDSTFEIDGDRNVSTHYQH